MRKSAASSGELGASAWAGCAVWPEWPALPSPARSSPRTTDSASTLLLPGTSLTHVFPVTAATSSHPLRELFLTDLCISYMRNTSTSVLVLFTGKCCNRAQLSNIHRHRAVGEGRLPSTVSQKLIKLEMRRQAQMKRGKLNSFPLLWNSTCLFRKEHAVSFHSCGRFSGPLAIAANAPRLTSPRCPIRKAQPPRCPSLRWWPLGGQYGHPAQPLLRQTRSHNGH